MGVNDAREQLEVAKAYAVELEALLAVVRSEAEDLGDDAVVALIDSSIDTDAALREVRAKALEEVADEWAVVPHPYEGGVTGWLRARAVAIREGRDG